jgi:CCR4-NOT transcription complex subunit 1
MSFDNPSSFAHWQSSFTSSSDQQDQSAQNRPPPSAWGQTFNSATNRRGLAPLATSNLSVASGSDTRRHPQPSETDSQLSATSPSATNFPPLLPTSSSRFGSRRPTPPASSQTNSPITILQPGGNQSFSGRSITSPRSRTITPSQQTAGAAGTHQHTGLGAGGGGGFARSGAYSPALSGPGVSSPTGFNFERSSSISSNPSSATGLQSSFAKISGTQVLLLLDTITEKKGKAEWEAKAEKIRKVWHAQVLLNKITDLIVA